MRSMLLAISFLTIAPVYGNRVADENSQFTVLLPISWIYHWYDTVCRCAPLNRSTGDCG